MIAFLIAALFIATALIAFASLADSAVRGRNAWRAVRGEMAAQRCNGESAIVVEAVTFRNMRPAHRGSQAQLGVNDQLAAAA